MGLPRGRGQHLDAARRGDDDDRSAADKEPAFDGTHGHRDVLFDQRWVGDRPKPAIENKIAAIGEKGLLADGVAPLRDRAECRERIGRRLPAELRHLDRHRGVLAEPLDQLFLVDDDDEAPARRGDDLFAQQGTAQALDQVQRAELDLVGAVDRQVDLLVFGKGRDRNAEPARLRRGALGGRDADDLEPLLDARRQPLDDKGGGRPGAEAEDHAVLDLFDRTQRRRPFQPVAIEDHAADRAARSANQTSSPSGWKRAAGKARSPASARASISRLSAPATRNAACRLLSSTG